MKITRLYEYDNGKETGWAVETADGGTLLVTIDKGGHLDVTSYNSEPRHPNIIGETLNGWHFYTRRKKPDQKHELVLVLDTSKGEVKLSVYRYGETSQKLLAGISVKDYL